MILIPPLRLDEPGVPIHQSIMKTDALKIKGIPVFCVFFSTDAGDLRAIFLLSPGLRKEGPCDKITPVMKMNSALEEALAILSEVTPLKSDCGRICDRACCASMAGEETGMLLFPSEGERYRGRPGWKILETAGGEELLICPGRCDRSVRPLSCRDLTGKTQKRLPS